MQGKRPATIDGYSRALRRITHHLDKSPDTLTTDDLKRYFAQLIKTHSWSTVRIDRNGLRKLWVSYVFCLPDKLANKWVVDCRYVGHGKPALLYLSTYLYRGIIADKDILYLDNHQVTFRYKDNQTKTMKTRTLPVLQFLWLILQHVLPKGLRRVRDYGLLRGHEKKQLQLIQYAFMLAGQLTLPPQQKVVRLTAQPFCPCCQHVMQLAGIFRPR